MNQGRFTSKYEAHLNSNPPGMEPNALFEAAPIGILYLHWDGGVLRANPAVCRLTGYTADELLRLDLKAISNPDDYGAELQIIQQLCAAQTTPQVFKTRWLRSDHSLYWVEVTLSRVGNPEHPDSYLLAFVTEHHPFTQSSLKVLQELQQARQEIQRQRERESVLSEIRGKLQTAFDLPTLLQVAVMRLQHVLDTDRVLAYQLAPNQGGTCVAEALASPFSSLLGRVFTAECIPPPYWEAYSVGRQWSVADIRTAELSACHRDMLKQIQVKSMVVVAIYALKEGSAPRTATIWGLLVVHHCRAVRTWTAEDMQLVQAIAHQAAIAIEQSSLLHQLQSHTQDLENHVSERTRSLEQSLRFETLIRTLTGTLRDGLDEDEMLAAAVQGLAKTLKVDGCYACLFQSAASPTPVDGLGLGVLDAALNETLEVRYEYFSDNLKFPGSLVGQSLLFQDWSPIVYQEILAGQTHVDIVPMEQTLYLKRITTDLPETDVPASQALQVALPVSELRVSRIISPICDDQGLIGVLFVFQSHEFPAQAHHFQPAEIKLTDQVAGQCAIAIRQARLYYQEHSARTSAECFRSFIETSPDVFIEYDRNLRYLSVNSAGTSLLGHDRDHILGKTNQELLGDAAETIETHIRQAFETGERVSTSHEVILPTGTKIFDATYTPIADPKGTVQRVLSSYRDVTELQQQWQLLEHQNHELTEATRVKEEFIATTSHELRTPLTAILGFSNILLQEFFGQLLPKQRDYLERIHSSGEHLLALINDILDLSRLEADRLELEPELISIVDLCKNAISLIQEQATTQNLAVQVDIEPDLDYMVADPRRLKQMLLNLLTNAVKFTAIGTVGLNVYSSLEETRDWETNLIHFEIWDTGIGISKADQQNLFSPFSQIDSSLNRKHQGTGLGLAITRKLTELHSGSVTLESSPNNGSRFTISLPWYRSPESFHQRRDRSAL